MSENKNFCSYYTAYVLPEQAWFVVAGLKGFEHVAFDRTIDAQNSIFEFFVPAEKEPLFCQIMDYFVSCEYVSDLQKKENRLINEAELV